MLNKIGVISTFPPTQCGIATYANDLIFSLIHQQPSLQISKIRLSDYKRGNFSEGFFIRNDQSEDYYQATQFINNSGIDILDIQHEYKIFGKPDGANINIILENVRKPIATTLHTVNFDLPKNRESIFQKIIARSDLLFIFSEEVKQHFINKYPVKESKIIVIPHGVPSIPFYLPSEILRRKSRIEDFIFISSGHMRETKGYEIAIKALYNLKNEIKNFHYYILGEDHPQNETAQTYRKTLIKLVNNLGLNDKITFINKYLPLEELIKLIQFADVCLLPYTRKEQSSSGVLALMIACGRPIVSTPFQYATSQIIEKSGVIAKTFHSFDFAEGIKSLIKRKNSFNEIMQYNHTLGQSWNWLKVANQYYSGYKIFLNH